ncbi:MAG: hypothetical protein QW594_02820 [Candidatus Woesearchaeota archaeon]
MATFLDLAFFEGLTPVFVFFLIFAIMYGVLSGTKLLGAMKSINAIIAFVIAIFIAINVKSSMVIITLVPWFVLIFVFLVLLIVSFKIFGVSDKFFYGGDESNSTVTWTILIVSFVILLGALSSVFGQEQLPYTGGDDQQATMGEVDLYAGNGSIADRVAVGRPDNYNTNTGNFNENLGATLYHPRVLGFVLIMLIGVMTISQLTKT